MCSVASRAGGLGWWCVRDAAASLLSTRGAEVVDDEGTSFCVDVDPGRPKLPRGSNSRHSLDTRTALVPRVFAPGGPVSSARFELSSAESFVPPSSSHLPLAKSALLGTSSEEDFAFDSSAGPRRPDAGLAADRRALSAASLSPVLGRVALDPGVARGWARGAIVGVAAMKPPFATVGSFSAFFLDAMMDDDDDDARFCLNRSSDDGGRRGPSVSAMAASVGRPRRVESVPARTCAGYALSTRVMKWAPWSTLNGSLISAGGPK